MNNIWVEKYRPATLDTYIGDAVLKERLAQYITQQDIPHLLFHGTAGTGKTTAAKLLINNIECDSLFINASDERGIDVIRDRIKTFASTSGFMDRKIVVLDEADALTPDAQAALRNMMEVFSHRTRFILTCNYVERIIPPIVSRCQSTALTPPSKKDVAVHIAKILDLENVEYEPKGIAILVNAYYPDIRRIIGTAEQNTTNHKLVLNGAEVIAGDSKLKVLDALMSNQTAQAKVNEIRQIIADARLRDYTELYTMLKDKAQDYAPSNVSQTIIYLAEGHFRDAFSIDKELTFMATIYKILTN